MEEGRIVSISISERKGERKHPVSQAFLLENRGVEHDAHAEGGLRQVSLLMDESIGRMRSEAGIEVDYGDFAENIVTRGIDLRSLKIGDRIRIEGSDLMGRTNRIEGSGRLGGPGPLKGFGRLKESALLQITMIGKECKTPCRIYYQAGACIMPQEGVFCRVLRSGPVRKGDRLSVERI